MCGKSPAKQGNFSQGPDLDSAAKQGNFSQGPDLDSAAKQGNFSQGPDLDSAAKQGNFSRWSGHITETSSKYDEENDPLADADPVTLLKSLMNEHEMKAADLARLLNVSEGLVSDMLHYRKGFSKKSILILSRHFKLRQEAFNRNER
ncbi:MAG: hypothetical protein J0M10_06310 [Chitinophagales bacterium]|nr:hypothetical protein [Chitinophagales bacterium]